MAEPFLGEIRTFGFDFAPTGWAKCEGQLLPINQNQALFALIGTTYGGDGRTTFALPNMQGRVPMHRSDARPLGEPGGEETHTVTAAEMAVHKHAVVASTDAAGAISPAGGLLAAVPAGDPAYYGPANHLVSLNPLAVAATGGGQPHENRQPYLTLNFIIALQGIFPSRN